MVIERFGGHTKCAAPLALTALTDNGGLVGLLVCSDVGLCRA
jgi:hypothetical protein